MVVAHHAHPGSRGAAPPNGWPIFIGVITSDGESVPVPSRLCCKPALRRLDHTGMNQRKRPSSAGSSRELRRRRVANNHAFPISDLPVELADRIFATLGLLDLSRIVAVSRFCHERLPTAIAACTKRLKLGGYANAVGLRSTNTLLAHLDAALPRLPRAIVVTWLADFDWRVRLAGLRALSLRGGGDSEGDSAGVSEQHGAAIAALQADPEPAVSALARSLLARIDPRRLTSPSRPEAQQAGEPAGQEAGQEAGQQAGEGAGQEAGAEAGEGAGASQSDDDVAASVEPPT